MPENTSCPRCGVELPGNAPAGLCPKCLLQAGLASEPRRGAESGLDRTVFASSFTPPPPEELARRLPHLEILELLGKGGMGAAYKARQPGLDRLVAVKILPSEVGADPAFAERFTREARALAALSHHNIVTVFDFGQVEGQFYIVMEFVDGANLRQITASGTLQPKEALAMIPQICEALQFAHDKGFVHRDIKPENILVDKLGRVKIADFGIAKLVGSPPAQSSLTRTHQAMGTPHYMAPEQMRGAGAVDHRADIYSLGVVFYELLTGQLPIGRFEPPSKKVLVDVRLDEVVLRALESEPNRRYQRASEVKSEVEQISSGLVAPPADSPHGPLTPASKISKPPEAGPRADSAPVRRVSRKAVWGLCWAPWFLVTWLMLTVTYVSTGAPQEDSAAVGAPQSQTSSSNASDSAAPKRAVEPSPPHRIAWWQWALLTTVLPLGLAAPFGTTILGLWSIQDIRQSGGRLTGLPVALIDSLLYPLLLLDGLVFGMFWLLCATAYELFRPERPLGAESLCLAITVLLSFPTCAYIDYRIARSAWRRASAPQSPNRPIANPPIAP